MRSAWRRAAAVPALAGAWLCLAGTAAAQRSTLPGRLPPEVPDVSGWERSTGLVELDDPECSIEYELYVDPERTGLYGITHYRIRLADPEQRRREGLNDNPKLQWNVDGRLLRRYECVLATAARECDWRELPRESQAYQRELSVILRILRIHRRLLHARARDLIPGD